MSVPAADLLTAGVPLPATEPATPGARRRGWMRSAEIVIPGAILLALMFFCFIWPLVYPVPAPIGGALQTPNLPLWSPGHIFGTDTVGNDIMSRILYGGRVSFEVAAAVQAIGLAAGGLLGLVAAYFGGWLDAV